MNTAKKTKTFFKKHITEGTWRNAPSFYCKHCEFGHPDETLVRKHVVDTHLPKPKKTVEKPTHTVDRYGNKYPIDGGEATEEEKG